ncbi:flagellar protein FlgN [Heliorestis acidaminivorans]|uniref:Flagellar protein FlgN n=1 Tax=Heliorestis acidaminivorans TaxID=553427 RepID=A0A6I0EVM7_9FIRM|nr:flagellar protein FlgN [Heliorestis acidaminivorans]KAB2953639.1 flagellar protein FlgN [Heliorestis acidaminivorans]
MTDNCKVSLGSGVVMNDAREDLFQRLLSVMNMQGQIFKGLLALAKSKEKALIESNIEEIKKLTEAENTLINQSGQVENLRQKVTEELIQSMGLSSAQSKTVSEIMSHLPEEWRPRLMEPVQLLQDKISDLNRQNEINHQLIQQSLEFCQHFYDLLSDVEDEATYDPTKNSAEGSERKDRSVLFNRRI